MDSMQFRDFIFPHNPASITVENLGRHATFFCPGHGEVVQTLSSGRIRVRCTGDFICTDAGESAALIASFVEKCADGKSGFLAVPGYPPFLAVLAEHSFGARGDGRVTSYAMQFIQAGG